MEIRENFAYASSLCKVSAGVSSLAFRSAIEQGQAAPVCRYERGPILESHTNLNADGF